MRISKSLSALAILGSVLAPSPAPAQDFPSKRVTLLVPTPAGGSMDGNARIFADPLKDRLGQAVVVENRTRWSVAPDVPTTYEQGLDFEAGFWYGVAVPSATPRTVQARIVRDFVEVAKLPDVKDLIRKLSMDPVDPSPAEMLEVMRREREQYATLAKSLGIAN